MRRDAQPKQGDFKRLEPLDAFMADRLALGKVCHWFGPVQPSST